MIVNLLYERFGLRMRLQVIYIYFIIKYYYEYDVEIYWLHNFRSFRFIIVYAFIFAG